MYPILIMWHHFSTATKYYLNKLQKVQNKACRIILKADRFKSTMDMHEELQLLTLNKRVNTHMSTFCHKNVYCGENPSALTNLLVPLRENNQAGRTRSHNDMTLKIPNIKSTMGQKAFAYRRPVHWNGLPGALKLLNKYDAFVCEIKERATSIFDNHPV